LCEYKRVFAAGFAWQTLRCSLQKEEKMEIKKKEKKKKKKKGGEILLREGTHPQTCRERVLVFRGATRVV
jgi:hypothetical protein